MIKYMENAEHDTALLVADFMASAARTAPKASGQDKIMTAILTDEDKDALVKEMFRLGDQYDMEFFRRDSGCVNRSHCIVIIGVDSAPFGLANCSLCGFKDCGEMVKTGGRCAVNITDLGVAVGSAVSIAADHRIDNRVMYTAGKAAVSLGIFPKTVKMCYGIPLYTGSKSIFFDRGPGAIL